MSTQLVKVQSAEIAALDEITSKDFAMVQADATKKFSTAFAVAAGVNKIKQTLTPSIMQEVILPLKDCGSLGFGTDEGSRNAPPYNTDVIKSCVTEALLRGAQLVGGEFMIFQGKTFFTKNYFERKVRSFPGLTNLDIECSTPRMSTGGAVIEVLAKFSLNGKPITIDRRGTNAIAIRLQGNGGADMAIGKAEKRMYRYILNYVSGYAPPAEPDDEDSAPTLKVVSNESTLTEDSNGNITATVDATVIPPVESTPAANVPPSVTGETPQGGNETTKRMIKGKKKADAPPVELPPPAAEAPAKPAAPAAAPAKSAPVAQEVPPPAESEQSEPGEEPGLEDEGEEQSEESAPAPIVCAVQKVTVAVKDKKFRVTTDQGDFFIFEMAQGKEFLTMKAAGKKAEITYEEVADQTTGAIERNVKTFKAV